jgi:hypothetical protein
MAHRLVTGMALVLLLFGSGSLGLTADMPASIREKSYNNVPYLSGGVGEEEIDLLRQVDGAYNVKLIFAATAGNYLSNVHILIEDSQGTKVLEAVSEGPWFYTNWTLAFFCCLTLVHTENASRREDNRSIWPPPGRPSLAEYVRVHNGVDAPHQPENAMVP